MKLLPVLVPFLLATAPAAAQWSEEAKLVPGDLGPGDSAGSSVAISGDTLVIGVPLHDGVATDAGAAYVYVRTSDGWSQQAKLRALDGGAGDQFGYSVSVSGDTALIGAPHHLEPKGAAYVFVRSGSSWSQQAKIQLTTSSRFHLGALVRVTGESAVIRNGLFLSDRVHLYERSGSTWNLQGTLAGGDSYDDFGCDIDVEGNWLVIGAPGVDDIFVDNVGAAYVYEKVGSTWTSRGGIGGSLTQNFNLGAAVAISGSSVLVASSPLYHQYLFAYERVGASWALQQTMYTSCFDLEIDGDLALSSNNWPAFGFRAHVYRRSASPWTAQETFGGWDQGGSMALERGRLVLGQPGDDDGGLDAGAVHVLVLEPGTGYCLGDPGSGTPCPCNNDNDGSRPGSGCDNGVFASGARLSAHGVANVSHDTVVLYTERAEPNNSGLYFQADNRVNGGAGIVFGDGLRCAGGQLLRLQVRFADATGYSHTSLGIASKGGVLPGDTKRYQCWYRNQGTPACGLGVNEFNLTNGYEIPWGP